MSFHENIDTNSPLGKVVFTIISAIAELERDIIAERIRGGLRRAKALGKRIGRPSLEVNKERIMILKAEGLSIRNIAKQMGASPAFVHKALKATHADVTGV